MNVINENNQVYLLTEEKRDDIVWIIIEYEGKDGNIYSRTANVSKEYGVTMEWFDRPEIGAYQPLSYQTKTLLRDVIWGK